MRLWDTVPCWVTEGGAPFTSRLFTNTRGLEYPSHLTSFTFICEGCTVRVFLKRELFDRLTDIHLLKLERMRMIDMSRLEPWHTQWYNVIYAAPYYLQ
jgi:hypothetical protein